MIRSLFETGLKPVWDGSDDADCDGDKLERPIGIPGDDIGRLVRIDADVGGGVDDSRDELEPVPVTLVRDGGMGDDPDCITVKATWRPAEKKENLLNQNCNGLGPSAEL